MALEKLRIKPVKSSLPEFKALFNPSSYSLSKQVTWTQADRRPGASATTTNRELNAAPLVFGGGGGRTLRLDLFFDVTEPIDGKPIKDASGKPVTDVRQLTNQVVALTRIERDKKRPPACELYWGNAPLGDDFLFTGVVTNLEQRFTLFRSTGEPIRATLTVNFTEYIDPEADKKQTDPDFTTYVVKRGDTLSAIAGRVYGSPAKWRPIANANGLDDPRRLQAGTRLAIPKLG